jgi:hypothetical protein
MYSNPSFPKPRVIKNFHMRNIYKTLSFSMCSWLASGFSNAASYDEHSLKAAFLYNFADFITWPNASYNEPLSDINYCVLQNGQVQNSLNLLISSHQNPAVKRDFRLLSRLNQIATCHLLFLDTSDLTTNPDLLKMTSGLPILTVGDQKGFLESGGMVKLARENNRMTAHLNVDILNEYAFPVSSQLMRLATIYPLNYSSEA